jgi:hypothetical protein
MEKQSSKSTAGRFNVQYESFPLNYNTSLMVLDTDYDNYAVIWSCSNIGPVGHTESAWVDNKFLNFNKRISEIKFLQISAAHVKGKNTKRRGFTGSLRRVG